MSIAKTAVASSRRRPPAERRMLEAWENWYARRDYRQMPWYSPRPSPWLVRALRDHWIPAGTPVLDVGCGSGSNVLWLGKQGYRAVGVDISSTVIAIAIARARRARVAVEFRTASGTDLPFRPRSFGAALDTGCFHSLPIPLRPRYVREIARVLRPGGSLLLTWIPREVRVSVGPPHRPALAEVAAAFEPWFLFEVVERHETGSPGGWKVVGQRIARCTALLIRRHGRQPSPW